MIVLMGSGETSPTMVELHKSLLRRSGSLSILDTPYGFQENADELTARAREYFTERVGVRPDVISLRSADGPVLDLGTALSAAEAAECIFAGPGSPTYALRQWLPLDVGGVLKRLIDRGGVVTLASAASITAGALSLPVYEIYKVGEHPYWERGLDLLSHVGLTAAVVPHFNNAEGGTHDTSCCYVGRRRLELLRSQRPEVPVLGIDEHTALSIDPQNLTVARVAGLGQVHILSAGVEIHVSSGDTLDLTGILSTATTSVFVERPVQVRDSAPDLRTAIADRDPSAVLAALIDIFGANPTTVASLSSLTPVLSAGWSDSAEPFRDLLLRARIAARKEMAWGVSDLIRDGLQQLGYAIEDTESGQQMRQLSRSPIDP